MIGRLLRSYSARWKFLQKALREDHVGPMVEVNDAGYRIFVTARGEALIYQDRRGAVLVDALVQQCSFYFDSIRKWDELKGISQTDRELIATRLTSYLTNYQECGSVNCGRRKNAVR